ncbi:hypothetical protein ACWD11_18255 [Streptomyces sp. NPDC002776]
MASHFTPTIPTRLSMWQRVREYAVPLSMIETATARRAAGDWAGACAAARVDVDLDLRAVRDRHGTEFVTRLRADLRRLAPDLLRWHMPRIAPDGRLRPGLTLSLARYPAYGGALAHLVVRTPPAWADAGQRMSLALWEESGTGHPEHHPHPYPDRRFRLDLHRHLWDAEHSGELTGRCGVGAGSSPTSASRDAGAAGDFPAGAGSWGTGSTCDSSSGAGSPATGATPVSPSATPIRPAWARQDSLSTTAHGTGEAAAVTRSGPAIWGAGAVQDSPSATASWGTGAGTGRSSAGEHFPSAMASWAGGAATDAASATERWVAAAVPYSPWATARWAAEAELLLRDEGCTRGAFTVRLGTRRWAVFELVAPDDSHVPTIRQGRQELPPQGIAALPVLPEAAARVLPDLELLRAGLITADRLHPLVAAALASTAPAPAPLAGPAGEPSAPSDPHRVECRGAVHRIALRDGALTAVDHDPGELRREELLVALGGPALPCLRAIDAVHRTPEALPAVRERLAHGDVAGALAVVEGLLGPGALLRDGPLREELESAAARRIEHGLFRSGLVAVHPAAATAAAEPRPRLDRRTPSVWRSKRNSPGRPRTALPL